MHLEKKKITKMTLMYAKVLQYIEFNSCKLFQNENACSSMYDDINIFSQEEK